MKTNDRMRWGSLVVAGVFGVAGFQHRAHADIILTQVVGPVSVAGGYNYTYDAVLSFNSEVSAGAPFTEFGTLYDAGTTAPAISNITGLLATSFNFSEPVTSTAAYLTAPTDSASYYNVRFTYNGTSSPIVGAAFNVGSTQIGTSPLDLGQFTITSPYSTEVLASFDGQSQASFGSAAGTEQGNVGSTTVPRLAVPEPASLGLVGFAATGLLSRRRRA